MIAALAVALPTTPVATGFTATLAFTAPLVVTLAAGPAEARGGHRGGGGNVRSSGRHNVNRNANSNRNLNSNRNVNRNTNRNVNRDVNRDVNVNRSRHVDVDVNHHYNSGWGGAGFVAGVATAVAIGAIVASLPPNCTTYSYSGIGYRQCGGTWYQPQYSGANVTYIVVNEPR
jgi:hypothetical protein